MEIHKKRDRKKNRVKNFMFKATIILVVCISVVGLILIEVDKRMLPYVEIIGKNYVKNYLNLKISNTVIKEINKKNISNEDLYKIKRDSNGNVKSLEVNTIKINEICAYIAEDLSKELMNMGGTLVELPAGLILNIELFSNLGPNYKIWVVPTGNVEVSYRSSFESGGYNQSRFKLTLEIRGILQIVDPLNTEELEVLREIELVNTIINGDVPLYSPMID